MDRSKPDRKQLRFRFSRTVGWVFIAIGAAALLVLILVWREPLPRIQMADGSYLQVLKVEVGTNSNYPTEPQWKRIVRRGCPDRWEVALLGSVPRNFFHRTRQESLFVWVSHPSADGQQTTDRKVWARLLLKPTGGSQDPILALFGALPGVACLEFRSYPRDAKRLSLKIWDGEKDVAINIANPRPVSRETWTAETVPQTNRFPGTEIILVRTGRRQYSNPDLIAPRFLVRSGSPSPAGWVEWSVTAKDVLGNWTDAGYPFRSPVPQFEWKAEGVWQLRAEGVEYISAGFVPALTNGAVIELPVPARSAQVGVHHVVAVGPGAYRMEDGVVAIRPETGYAGVSAVDLSPSLASSPKVWKVDLFTPYPGVLCVAEGRQTDHAARLRERPGKFTGGGWHLERLEVDGKRLWFRFFSRKPLATDEQLEVEVFGPLPPATFYVR